MDIRKKSLEKHYEWNGKIEVISRAPITNSEELSLAYTPGVAEPCLEIQKDYDKSFKLTRRNNLVAFITDGTEESECLIAVDLLRRAGIETELVSCNGTREILSSHQIKIVTDKTFEEASFEDSDMLFIPGGMPGAANLRACPLVIKWVKKFAEEDKYVAAICAGPMVLKEAGISTGRTLTSYPADKYREMFSDADYIDDNSRMDMVVVQDGKLKHLTYYDQQHRQHISVDLLHPHKGVQPHIHVDLNHDPNSPGVSPTTEQIELIKKIKKEFHLL